LQISYFRVIHTTSHNTLNVYIPYWTTIFWKINTQKLSMKELFGILNCKHKLFKRKISLKIPIKF
jgi:hypothetical protein